MALKFYNTLSRSLQEFEPIAPPAVKLYTCGPTVYNFAHIGNYRAYVFEDILRRVLKLNGFEVTQVMNLTDVDDKTIRDSRVAGTPLDQFTKVYKDAFFADLEALRVEPAEVYPAATDHIAEMIELIEQLMAKGFAYQGDDGSVYYSINKFAGYGQLARVDLAGQRAGVRISTDEYDKESVADFALWKAWSELDGDVVWDSPWGRGRPGWHIECSAMSMKYLGHHFDIHTGGVDNMFPHHDDEIAQSEAATGEKFVNYWLHCAHLIVEGKKMSKSEGNFFTLRDLLDKGYSGREVRWLLIGGHYRQQLNFTFDGLTAARTVLQRFDELVRRLREVAGEPEAGADAAAKLCQVTVAGFRDALEDDLNVAGALAAVFDFLRDVNRGIDAGEFAGPAAEALLGCLRQVDMVLGVLDVDAERDEEAPPEILAKVEARQAARKAKDFATSDAIRDELAAAGWVIEDTPKGVRVKRG